jgi:hypothetical protein
MMAVEVGRSNVSQNAVTYSINHENPTSFMVSKQQLKTK